MCLKAVGGRSQIHPRPKIEVDCFVFKLYHLVLGLQAVRHPHEEDDCEEEEGFFVFFKRLGPKRRRFGQVFNFF